MRNKRLMIIIAIIALAIGFATVSTVLYINGTTIIGANNESFDHGVIFKTATTDDGGTAIIEQDGKSITFNSKVLVQKDDSTVLNYTIANLDKNYDATAEISCKFLDEDKNEVNTNSLIDLALNPTTFNIVSGGTVNGTLTATLIHNVEVETNIEIKCTVIATAIERTSAGNVVKQNTNAIRGIFTDKEGTPITSGYVAVFSNEMKVVELQNDGSFEVTGLEDGTHEIYYMGSTDPTGKTKSEIKTSALVIARYSTTSTKGIIEIVKGEDKYLIATVYEVTFEGTNFTSNPETLKYVVGKENKVTITPSSGYYLESISCTNGYTTNAIVGEDSTSEQEIIILNNGNLKNSECTVIMNKGGNKFETDSWETIQTNIQNGNYGRYTVGETRTVDLGSSLGTHTLRVANNSNYDCTLESKTACGFVVEFEDIIVNQKMNPTNTSAGGWPASDMYKYLNPIVGDSTTGVIYNALPETLRNVIIDTTVVSGYEKRKTANYTSTDKLYLLSSAEVWQGGVSYDSAKGTTITRQLDYYTGVTTSSYAKAIKKINGTASSWWLRAADSDHIFTFTYVHSYGSSYPDSANNDRGVSPAFRIG